LQPQLLREEYGALSRSLICLFSFLFFKDGSESGLQFRFSFIEHASLLLSLHTVNAFSFVYRGLFFLTGFFFLSSCGMYLRYSLNNKIKDSYIILNIYHEKLYIYKHIYTKLILKIYIILYYII
jgi:hypothetical protein